MANEIKEISEIVTGFRKVIQDLLVPELKAIKKQLESHEQEFTRLWEEIRLLREEMRDLRQEMNIRFEAIQKEIHEIKVEQKGMVGDIHEIKTGQREILLKPDLERRVNRLELLIGKSLKKEKIAA
ncbi:MAG: hypothetical protein AB1422_14070 [bacterium]